MPETKTSDSHSCRDCGRSFDTKRGLSLHQSAGHGKPWTDEKQLREAYHNTNLTVDEVADELGCSRSTLANWVRKFGMEHRGMVENQPWRDEERLYELYHERGLSMPEIADRIGCSKDAISTWMDRYSIDRRSSGEAVRLAHLSNPPRYIVNNGGYSQVVHVHHRDYQQVLVHRLLAVAEWGFDAVKDKLVHHKNEIPWDNRPSNLELVEDVAIHQRIHADVQYPEKLPWRDEDKLRELYVEKQLSQRDIAELFECSSRTIQRWLRKHGIRIRGNYETQRGS